MSRRSRPRRPSRRPARLRRAAIRVRRWARAARWELVVIALLVAAVVPTLRADTSLAAPSGRDGSSLVRSAAPVTFRPSSAATSYRVVYRNDDTAGPAPLVTTEEIVVRRPFDGRTTTRAGAPPGRELLSDQVTRFGRVVVLPVRAAQPLNTETPPAIAGPDVRLAALPELLRSKTVQRREVREVLGRRCQVYRAPGPFGGTFDAPRPTASEYADACFDEAGLMLEEVWVSGGKRLRRRIAIEVNDPYRPPRDAFPVVGDELDPAKGGGSVREVDPQSDPLGDSWRASAVPAGFRLLGRYAVVPAHQGADDPTQRDSRIASTIDVWVRGIDVLVVDQGGTLGQKQVFQEDEQARAVDLGPLGRGRVLPSLRMSEVRIIRPKGRFVRVTGTITPDELVEVARSLQPVANGSGLVYR